MNMLKRSVGISLAIFVLAGITVEAVSGNVEQTLTAFRNVQDLTVPAVRVPTVVEVSVDEASTMNSSVGVLDTETSELLPYFYKSVRSEVNVPFSIETAPSVGVGSSMTDGNYESYAQYDVPETGAGEARITIVSPQPITLSKIGFALDYHVAAPTGVEVRSVAGNGKETILYSMARMQGTSVFFPKTTAERFTVTLRYAQPLRITELLLRDEDSKVLSGAYVRFLAQPGHEYRLYSNPDRAVSYSTREGGDLGSAQSVVRITGGPVLSNQGYVPADTDGDAIPDAVDNCIGVANQNQEDVDGNGRGDACDDFDRDGVLNSADNCRDHPNRSQRDTDADGMGDECDAEESRLTERLVWLPWLGLGLTAGVLLVLFVLTMRKQTPKDESTPPPTLPE